ncbi:MAG: hypothetical protein ACE366_24380 [Bradymonadia bacterium]
MRHALALLCLGTALTLLTACDDESSNDTPTPTSDAELSPDQGAGADASTMNDAEVVADAGPPDATPGCGEAVMCDPLLQRVVDCACESVFDRRCVTDADCRPEETCQDVEGHQICYWEPPANPTVCPGAPGCMGEGDPTLLAAAVSKVVTPSGFETARPEGLEDDNTLNFNPPDIEGRWNDCGYDGLCPDDAGYPGPDEGEGDGVMQGMWIAGFSSGRPAQYCPEEKIGCDAVDCCVSKYAHDDLKVQIAVMRQRDVTVAFAVVDTIGFLRPQSRKIFEDLPPELEVDLLVMGATHNHEAPDTAGQWGPGDPLPLARGVDAQFEQLIHDQTIAGITEAVANLKPATAKVAVLDVGTEGLAINDSRTPYIFDDNVPVVRLEGIDGSPIGTLMSFANHPEVLWDDNPFLTSDYPHFVRKYIREGLPATMGVDGEMKPALEGFGGVTLMYVGAVGGLIYPGPGGARDYAGNDYTDGGLRHTFAAADAIGQTLASRVLGAGDGAFTTLDAPDLRFATQTFFASVENRVFQLAAFTLGVLVHDIYNVTRVGAQYAPALPQLLTQTAVVGLGPVTFFTAPGEVFPETLVGGYPGRSRVQTPVIGDVEGRRVAPTCDDQGLPTDPESPGDQPCIVKADQTNPPDWDNTPEGPYVYERLPGEFPFFIGLGMDFLGYMVPSYNYEEVGYLSEPPGDHYEETNGVGRDIMPNWEAALDRCIEALP